MIRKMVRYFLALFILLTSGLGYLSASVINPGSTNAHVNKAQHPDFVIKSLLSSSEHKIDIAENEIEEDESESAAKFLENHNHSWVFHTQTAGCLARESKKDIPFYLMFCTIRI